MVYKRLKLLSEAIKNGEDHYTFNNKVYYINDFDRFFSKYGSFSYIFIGGTLSKIFIPYIPKTNTDEVFEPRITFSFDFKEFTKYLIVYLIAFFIMILLYELYCHRNETIYKVLKRLKPLSEAVDKKENYYIYDNNKYSIGKFDLYCAKNGYYVVLITGFICNIILYNVFKIGNLIKYQQLLIVIMAYLIPLIMHFILIATIYEAYCRKNK